MSTLACKGNRRCVREEQRAKEQRTKELPQSPTFGTQSPTLTKRKIIVHSWSNTLGQTLLVKHRFLYIAPDATLRGRVALLNEVFSDLRVGVLVIFPLAVEDRPRMKQPLLTHLKILGAE